MKKVIMAMLVVACWYTAVLAGEAEEVRVSYHDGVEYVVSGFRFYTDHEAVTGFYFERTTDSVNPLLVRVGKLWHEVKGEDVVAIRLEPDASRNWTIKAHIELKGGQTIRGDVPLSFSETWESGDYFWIQGLTTKFGKPAKLKLRLSEIALVETHKGSPKPFKIKIGEGDVKEVEALEFGLYGDMPYSSPSYYSLPSGKVEIESENLIIDVPLKDILRFTFDEKGTATVVMRDGETGRISFVDVTRIYGRLETGEILFESIHHPKGAKIKSIEFQ